MSRLRTDGIGQYVEVKTNGHATVEKARDGGMVEPGQYLALSEEAPDLAAIDRVLGQLGQRNDLFPVRCLANGEGMADLAPAVRVNGVHR